VICMLARLLQGFSSRTKRKSGPDELISLDNSDDSPKRILCRSDEITQDELVALG